MDFNDAVDKLAAARAKQVRVTLQKKGISDAEAAIAKKYVNLAVKRADGQGKQPSPTGAPPAENGLSVTRDKLAQLGDEAAVVLKALAEKDEKGLEADVLSALAGLDESYATLNNCQNLVRARQSAMAACEKGNFAGAGSLSILAAVYAAQCNFDRAEFYQKLAVIFATDEQRPKILETLENYRAALGLISAKKLPKTSSLPGGKAARSAPPDEGDGGEE